MPAHIFIIVRGRRLFSNPVTNVKGRRVGVVYNSNDEE